MNTLQKFVWLVFLPLMFIHTDAAVSAERKLLILPEYFKEPAIKKTDKIEKKIEPIETVAVNKDQNPVVAPSKPPSTTEVESSNVNDLSDEIVFHTANYTEETPALSISSRLHVAASNIDANLPWRFVDIDCER